MSSKTINRCNGLLFVSSLITLLACNPTADKQVKKLRSSDSQGGAAVVANQHQQKDSIIKRNAECIRGRAEPISKKKYFANTTFVLQPDSLTAVETVSFKNGDKLIITNWGCEYYVLTFRFETSRFHASTSNLKYWYAAAGELTNKAIPGIDAPLDIKKGVRALNSYAAKDAKHLRLQAKLDFGGDEAIRFATLDTIAKMQKNRTAVVISFTAGLL